MCVCVCVVVVIGGSEYMTPLTCNWICFGFGCVGWWVVSDLNAALSSEPVSCVRCVEMDGSRKK